VINLGDLLRRSVKAGQLYSRPGNDLTRRFPLIFEALARLKARTGIIDGEGVACGPDGIGCSTSSGIGGMSACSNIRL
jgi:ATP-dependent DNA ligase